MTTWKAQAQALREALAQGSSTAFVIAERPDVARVLRKSAKRALPRWSDADGYVCTPGGADDALKGKGVEDAAYSPTAMQFFASCPYRFYLYAVRRYRPSEPKLPYAVDALTRGSLLHDIYFRAGVAMRAAGLFPVKDVALPEALPIVEEVVADCIARARALSPHVHALVWDDAMAEIRMDAAEWLRSLVGREEVPAYFELAFGLDASGEARDAASVDEAVRLDCGLLVRGSVDLVERLASGALRATDYKTGKVAAEAGDIVQGGELLQPVLYALVLEKVLRHEKVWGGRLWYGTFRGEYKYVDVPLDRAARDAANTLGVALAQAMQRGAFPKAPVEGACTYCEYRSFCDEAVRPRAALKPHATLPELAALRRLA